MQQQDLHSRQGSSALMQVYKVTTGGCPLLHLLAGRRLCPWFLPVMYLQALVVQKLVGALLLAVAAEKPPPVALLQLYLSRLNCQPHLLASVH
jgi:hypothetical protein